MSVLSIFEKQQNAFKAQPTLNVDQRLKNLKTLKQLLLNHQAEFAAAISEDFGNRSVDETKMAELLTSVQAIDYTVKNLKKWAKAERRKVHLLFMPASNKVLCQPLGVVGIIVPWNYPLMLSIGPLITAIAAGNHAMIKLSELTPRFNQLFKSLLLKHFDEQYIAIVQGDAKLAADFTSLPFDHILFTGSVEVGKKVMASAAKNLTPVTLELGGKSPAIISKQADIDAAAQRLLFGKTFSAGQSCVAPDYVLLHKDHRQAFIDSCKKAFNKKFPTINDNPQYTSIIDEKSYNRLHAMLDEAKHNGGEVICLSDDFSPEENNFKLPLHLVFDAPENSALLKEEIFGPILPVVFYERLEDAVEYVNKREKPLALYFFSYDSKEQKYITEKTISGGMAINASLIHLGQQDIPFGGVGHSGMGHYHGKEGFLSMSKAKPIHKVGRISSSQLARAPYGRKIHQLIEKIFIR